MLLAQAYDLLLAQASVCTTVLVWRDAMAHQFGGCIVAIANPFATEVSQIGFMEGCAGYEGQESPTGDF